METKGYVSYVGSNNYKGKELWSFRLKNLDKFFNCGTSNPKVSKNSLITFNYEESNGRNNVDVGSIEHIDLSASASPGKSAPSGAGAGLDRDSYWKNKEERDVKNERHRLDNEKRIQYQSARNAAISVVDILTREKALKLPAKDPGDAILGKIDDLTEKYFEAVGVLGTGDSDSPSVAEVGFEAEGIPQ